jgi:hypothetical protein
MHHVRTPFQAFFFAFGHPATRKNGNLHPVNRVRWENALHFLFPAHPSAARPPLRLEVGIVTKS